MGILSQRDELFGCCVYDNRGEEVQIGNQHLMERNKLADSTWTKLEEEKLRKSDDEW